MDRSHVYFFESCQKCVKQGRGPELPDLHGVEPGELVGWGGGGELGTDLLYHQLPGSQVELLD